jgi:hypothetical protein
VAADGSRQATSAREQNGAGRRIRLGPGAGCFTLHVRHDDWDHTPPLVRLKAVCGPGDDGDPVVTVMGLDED